MIWPSTLRDEACKEAYEFFDRHIRELPRKSDGTFDEGSAVFSNSDVDAFRHAFVSGIFVQVYGEKVADIFGILNELLPYASPRPRSPGETNMDLWNNAVGRRYGVKAKSRDKLGEFLKEALDKGEMIITPGDKRRYTGEKVFQPDADKPVVVLEESKTGENKVFFDLVRRLCMDRITFVSLIEAGNYPGYRITMLSGEKIPVSKSDGSRVNNLG